MAVNNNSEMSKEIEIYRMLDRANVFSNGAASVLSTVDKLVNRDRIMQELAKTKAGLERVEQEIARIDGSDTTPVA